ncbi:hypothetical protein JCM33374_g160 [Metschnikowia sp. JCM 33374]|nr:hypothetical protein JCM33374_g160 [Metschnikowia sp. JCM 33374]
MFLIIKPLQNPTPLCHAYKVLAHPINICALRKKASASSRMWIDRQSADPFTKQSIADGYRSRAAYKLLEIDRKFKIFKKSTKNIVDLGFAPGAWTQVALARSANFKTTPKILGVDLIDCSPPLGSHFLEGDIFSRKTHQEIDEFFAEEGLDVVLSDMMCNSSGNGELDHFASMDICEGVVILASRLLQKNGSLVMKYFTGSQDGLLCGKLETHFSRVDRIKPKACRERSREMYMVCTGKKSEKVDLLRLSHNAENTGSNNESKSK